MKRVCGVFLALALLCGLAAPALGQSTVQTPYVGMWLTGAEIAALPTTGAAWSAVKAAAGKATCTPDLSNQDDNCDQYVLAAALIFARTGDTAYRDRVIAAIRAVPGTEKGGRTLALARNLLPVVVAADLINLPDADPALHQTFSAWLAAVRRETLDGRTLVSTHEDRPNNWGTHAGASRIAAAIYLGDKQDLAKAAAVFRGWTGERDAYAGFEYGALDWQCDSSKPVGVNPAGCTRNGIDIGGAQPEEMRRGGTLKNPPAATGYPWEALQGAVVQMMLLERAGYPAAQYGDRAVLRAVDYLYRIGWPAVGDDLWIPWIINAVYGTDYPTRPAQAGKNMGFTDWTHAGGVITAPPATSTPKPTAAAPTATSTTPPPVPTLTMQPTNPAPPAPLYLVCYPADAQPSAVRSGAIDVAADPAPKRPDWLLFVAGLAIGGLATMAALRWLVDNEE